MEISRRAIVIKDKVIFLEMNISNLGENLEKEYEKNNEETD